MSRVASAQPNTLRGALMIMTAVAMFVVMDSISKYLSRFYPVPAIVWARYVFHLLLVSSPSDRAWVCTWCAPGA
jgi:hypothetical protein